MRSVGASIARTEAPRQHCRNAPPRVQLAVDARQAQVGMRFEENEEVEAQLKELEYLVKKCRIHYEQFFMGNEKREPTDLRRKIQNFLKNSAIEKHRRASVKFRYLTITQKFVTLSNYWDRILRSMEEGTFNTMTYRGFRPRAADGDDARPASADREERGVVRIDPEEMERESIARLAEHWGEQKVVDDREPATPMPELSPDDVEQVFPPATETGSRRARTEPAPPPRPPTQPPLPPSAPALPPRAPAPPPTTPTTVPEPRPSQRPTVPLDGPQVARPAAPAPTPPAPSPVAAAAQAARAAAPTAARLRPPEPPPAPVEVVPGARRLYDKYRQAKVNAIADSEDLSYEQFESRLTKKREMLKEKFQQDFEFDVVSRDGKVSIVAKKK